MTVVIAGLDPSDYSRHPLHDPARIWPETNCYVDLWIEVLHSLRLVPEAMLGFTVTQDFEGDQFTFFKVPLEDLETLYGLRVTELAIFDRVETHVAEQIRRGRLCLVEVDSYFLPDTQGVSYRSEHGKTTIAINALDLDSQRLEYFHNAGYYLLEGEDFDGVFQRGAHATQLPFLPYAEFAKLPDASHPPLSTRELRRVAATLLARHLARRPTQNPFAALSERFPAQVEALTDRPFDAFHKYAFNTLRQAGANFELAASHFDWLAPEGQLAAAARRARTVAETCKTVQFQLARALARKRFGALETALSPAAAAWDELMTQLDAWLAAHNDSNPA